MSDDDPRELCRQLLCNGSVTTAALRDSGLLEEVRERLDQVGFVLAKDGEQYWAAAVGGDSYTTAQRAAIALLAVGLQLAPDPTHATPQLGLGDFCDRLGSEQGWSRAWIRRAVLGPLERDGYCRIVKPDGNRTDAYIVAGPRLAMVDTLALQRLLASDSIRSDQ